MRHVLDADVLIGALDASDPHHRQARRLFRSWHRHRDDTIISAINLSEALVAPSADNQQLRAARLAIAALEVAIHQPTEAIAVQAARLRGRHPISLPDAYLLATARQIGAAVASFDLNVTRAAESEQLPITNA